MDLDSKLFSSKGSYTRDLTLITSSKVRVSSPKEAIDIKGVLSTISLMDKGMKGLMNWNTMESLKMEKNKEKEY